MKSRLLFCFVLFSLVSIAQEIPPDLLKKMQQVRADSSITAQPGIPVFYPLEKGQVKFADGTSARFLNLVQSGDSVTFTNLHGNTVQKVWYEIALVTEPDPKAGEGALLGGGIGLVTGLLTGILVYPENNFLETLIQLFSKDEDVSPKISKKAVPLIIGVTAAGTAIGALIGATHHHVIYESRFPGTFTPGTTSIPGQKEGIMVTWAISF